MVDDDLPYLLRRAAHERARAAQATDPEAKAAHYWLAEHYEARIRERDAGEGTPIRNDLDQPDGKQ